MKYLPKEASYISGSELAVRGPYGVRDLCLRRQ